MAMRPIHICLLVLLAAGCATGGGRQFRRSDRTAIQRAIDRQVETARRAWMERNAAVIIPDTSEAAAVTTSQGETIRAVDMRADIQRRMDMTTRVDTLAAFLDSVRVVTSDSVLTYSTQRFVRVIKMRGTPERQRFSTVVHEQAFVRRKGKWTAAGPIREMSPKAWWAGDPLPASP